MRTLVFLFLVIIVAGAFVYVRINNFIKNLEYNFTIDKIDGLGMEDLVGIGTSGSNANAYYTMTLINNSSFGLTFKRIDGEFSFGGNIIGTTSVPGPIRIFKDAVSEVKGSAVIFLNSSTKDILLGATSGTSKSIPIDYKFIINWFGIKFTIRGQYDISKDL